MFLTICLNPTIQKTLRFPSIVPGAVNRASAHRLDVSGKGVNVTRVLNQLGKKAIHLTQLSGVMRPLFLFLCEQDGLSVEWVESGSEIRFCYTVMNESDNKVTELIEESQPVCANTEQRILKLFDKILKITNTSPSPLRSPLIKLAARAACVSARSSSEINCVIISGTKAAGFSDAVIPTMTRRAKEKGLRVILDIKGNDLIECLKYEPDVIKPNLEEFVSTFNTEPTNEMLIEIAQKYKCRIILTNGSQKIIAAEKKNSFEIDVPFVKAINTTGCGDAFTAGFAAALENGADFKAAINEGIRCGALNAALERPGVIK